MGLSVGWKLNTKNGKTSQYTSHVSPPRTGSSATGAGHSQPIEANRGTHRQGPGAATQVSDEEPWLVQNTVTTNSGS